MSAGENTGNQNNNNQLQPVQNNSNALQIVQNSDNVSSNAGNDTNNSRRPRDMSGLLKFLLETTKNEDGTQSSQFSPLDEERKQFLTKVLESMTLNIAEKLTDALKEISKVGNITLDDDPSECENALESLFELVDQVDIANDFVKIGGLQACKPCLSSPHSGIRWRAAQLVGECAQNNPNCQDNAVQSFFLDQLIKLVDTDSDEQVRVKSLYAISSILRGNEKSVTFFHDIDACYTLIRALQSDSDKLKIKVAFLLSTAFVSDEFLKTQLQKMGLVTLLVQLVLEALREEKLISLEHFLGALVSLSENIPDALNDYRQHELNFPNILDEIISTYKNDSACLEAVTYATSLKNLINSNPDSNNYNADR